MFIRGNAVFMTSGDVKRILKDSLRQLDFVITADDDSSFIFYDDDGHTENYKQGVYSRVNISVKSGDKTIITFNHEGSYESTLERMIIKLVSKLKGAYWVSVDGHQIPRFIVRDNFNESREGWYYDLSDRTICVKTSWPVHEVIISTEKFDLIGMTEE